MSGNQTEELDKYQSFRRAYLRAFEKMLKEREKKNCETKWQTPEDVMQWWIKNEKTEEQIEGQISMEELEGL